MKKLFFTISFLIILSQLAISQSQINENFESYDSTQLPPGWTTFNNAPFPIDPLSSWMVRDTGRVLDGLATALSKAHSPIRSIGATWISSIDTNTNTTTNGDCWLVTSRLNITANDSICFWATGGSSGFSDSMQIWIGVDSLPPDFTTEIGSIYWPVGSTYGQFNFYKYSLGAFAGQTIWLGFRYCSNGTGSSGYAVQLDDIFIGNPIGIKPISTNIPKVFALKQNYPNPFNPITNIDFDLPKASFVSIVIYNELGQKIRDLVNQSMQPGSYKVDFDATNLPSGVYFYRINAGTFVQTKKMVLTK